MNPFEPFSKTGEQPLEHLCPDGGFSAIFRTVGCVGDSLSSGEFETVFNGTTHYYDVFEQSWGQYLARMNGSTVYNFSRGGMTAKTYCESFAEEKGFWDKKYACQAYILALGVNDLSQADCEIGTLADIDPADWRNNRPTFTGYYAQIVQRLKEIQPDAYFFLMTIPRSEKSDPLADTHAERLRELAEFFENTYTLDFRRYAPIYDQDFHTLYFLGGHMNPCGYLLTARMVASYLDYIIRHHPSDFVRLGLMEPLPPEL